MHEFLELWIHIVFGDISLTLPFKLLNHYSLYTLEGLTIQFMSILFGFDIVCKGFAGIIKGEGQA